MSISFDYPWWLSYGHLAILIPALAGLALTRKYKLWPIVFGGIALWALAGFAIVRTLAPNDVPPLPTQAFLAQGTGRVLDIGAGTGRSAIMVLRERPQATLTASDLFAGSFEHHFGHSHDKPQDRLLRNLTAAGVANRASIETADMLKLKFPDQSFDAIVSAYAMDHVGRSGAKKALSEAHRVLKPNGDFLLILNNNDLWAKIAFGPMLTHGGTPSALWWRQSAAEAGFDVIEESTAPITLRLLLRRRP